MLLSCTGNLISHGLRQQESINEYHQTVREGFEWMRTTGNTPNRVMLRKKWSAHEFIVSFGP